MPKPKDRASSKRVVFRRTPGGRNVRATKKAVKNTPHCAICGVELNATKYSRLLRKTEKRPERPFGGFLCHKCTERLIMYRTRVEQNDMKAEDVPLAFQRFL